MFLSHPIFPVFFEVIFLQFLRNFSSNECRFRSNAKPYGFLKKLYFRAFSVLFSCQFQIIYRTKKEAKDLWSNASFFIFSLTFQENFHSKIRTILENRGRRQSTFFIQTISFPAVLMLSRKIRGLHL